ncbi:hypothetical protein ACFWUP_21955 [Nocardia sp. NPDC058658]|uniref:hypothetical protein n=1 Tax=Nocardia sp. NPDC058658 TaxID=3346580 RepID=UPI0036674CDE
MRNARIWAATAAASPIVFPVLTIAVAYLVDAITGTGADVAWYLVFTLLLGTAWFLPGIGLTLIGIVVLPRRSGAVLTVLALVLLVLASAAMGVGVFDDALSPLDDQPRLIPMLSIPEAVAVVAPYALVVLACLRAAVPVIAAARGVATTADAPDAVPS